MRKLYVVSETSHRYFSVRTRNVGQPIGWMDISDPQRVCVLKVRIIAYVFPFLLQI